MTSLFSPWFVSLLRVRCGGRHGPGCMCPCWALFGGKDVQVPADSQAPALRPPSLAAGDTDVTVTTLPDANHLFQSARTGASGRVRQPGAGVHA